MTNREKLLSNLTVEDFQAILCNHLQFCFNCPLNTETIPNCHQPNNLYEQVLNEWLDKEAQDETV